VRSLYAKLGIERGPETPGGVAARVVEGRTLYVNTRNAPATVPLHQPAKDLLSGTAHSGQLSLEPYGVALLEK
jgi:beta-galactosidase